MNTMKKKKIKCYVCNKILTKEEKQKTYGSGYSAECNKCNGTN